jgi:hypothetical protein
MGFSSASGTAPGSSGWRGRKPESRNGAWWFATTDDADGRGWGMGRADVAVRSSKRIEETNRRNCWRKPADARCERLFENSLEPPCGLGL